MASDQPFPGTPHHQELLRLITRFYAGDDRVLALVVFGSLGRGAGDAWSDLDLAVIVRDGIHVDISAELARLAAALAEYGDPVLSTADAGDAGYLIPQSLCGIAIDYTELAKVSSYVQHGRLVLGDTLDLETIRKAAAANDKPPPPCGLLLQKALWLALGADIYMRRHQFWQALPKIESVRGTLIDIYAFSRGSTRASKVFAETASEDLQAKFGRTLPAFVPHSTAASLAASAAALSALLDLMERDFAELSNDQLQLGPGERAIIARLRKRLATLDA
ncbi:MAG: nucleotidyltransferase domain-containing protein [Caldilineaceae bacterium]